MRKMADSVTPADLPTGLPLYAAYVDGRYANAAAVRKRFPKATVITITVTGTTAGAHVIDCEPGDATPTSAARWAKREVQAGRTPTIYCMASQWQAVKNAVAKEKITGKVNYWIASYDNKPVIPHGAVAKQYADPTTHRRGHFDLSVVADYWPGVDPEPVKPPIVKHPAKATRIKPHTRAALRLVIRHLNKRKHAVAKTDRDLLTKAQLALNSALGIKEKP